MQLTVATTHLATLHDRPSCPIGRFLNRFFTMSPDRIAVWRRLCSAGDSRASERR